MVYINNKTKNFYEVLYEAIDATNSRDGNEVIVYRELTNALPEGQQPKVFVRDKSEFFKKFTEHKPSYYSTKELSIEDIESIIEELIYSQKGGITFTSFCLGRQTLITHSSNLQLDQGLCDHPNCKTCREISNAIKGA